MLSTQSRYWCVWLATAIPHAVIAMYALKLRTCSPIHRYQAVSVRNMYTIDLYVCVLCREDVLTANQKATVVGELCHMNMTLAEEESGWHEHQCVALKHMGTPGNKDEGALDSKHDIHNELHNGCNEHRKF